MKSTSRHPIWPWYPKVIVMYVVLVIGSVVFLVVVRLNVVKISYQVSGAKQHKGKLHHELLNTEIEKSTLLVPAHVEQLAKDRFRLQKVVPQQLIYLDSISKISSSP